MLIEDIFDGWLAVPSMAGFLQDEDPAHCHVPLKQITLLKSHGNARIEPAQLSALDDQSPTAFVEHTPTTSRGPRQRRGHTKSRLGCIVCKRRKIKCQETWPSCANCVKRGSVCRYPTIFTEAQRDRVASELPRPRRLVQLSDTPPAFDSNDMRLFHHYMIAAYPCIPHDYEDIWIRDIPTISHENSYLMHAILALAGSHLALQVENPQIQLALSHRQKAITGLEDAFTRWPPSANEAHVMLAAGYLLSFQSSYIEDGFLDFILSLRGCALLSQLICNTGLQGPFAVQANMHSATMDHAFQNFPHLDQDLAREALQSIAKFSHLVSRSKTHTIQETLVMQLVETIAHLLEGDAVAAASDTTASPDLTDAETTTTPSSETDSTYTTPYGKPHFVNPLFPTELPQTFDNINWNKITMAPSHTRNPLRSFNALMSTLVILSTWPYDAIIHLLSPKNQLGNVIMAHFFAVRFIISPLSATKNTMRTPVKAMIQWTIRIIAAIEDDEDVQWTRYVEWPKKILRCLEACLEKKQGLWFEDLRDMVINEPEAYKEGRARRSQTNVSTDSIGLGAGW
ncbi:hypothetical protein BKA66DRAFT_573564 [Pyrenochaeta sp. MPI-SDFR-AT-0127]|nr:hypothetical protein BKA66DRAFT_573564 [Pyrenochaeta sp. MPI-SDFR-AT-0127]